MDRKVSIETEVAVDGKIGIDTFEGDLGHVVVSMETGLTTIGVTLTKREAERLRDELNDTLKLMGETGG